MGAMGVEDVPDLHYARSKAKAEALVRASGLDWTILKPSLQFGTGDGFFNIIAGLIRMSPGVVPVPGTDRQSVSVYHPSANPSGGFVLNLPNGRVLNPSGGRMNPSGGSVDIPSG